MKRLFTFLLTLACLSRAQGKPPFGVSNPLDYTGAADGSAGVALDGKNFATASDEDNVIRVYSRGKGGAPQWSTNLTQFLEVPASAPETDIEAAARIDGRVYWISSHARNQHGHERLGHYRFFATDIITNTALPQLSPVGHPCKTLLSDLAQDSRLARFNIAEAANRAPKSSGALSIEGLCATPDKHLLIGFRNPVPQGIAVALPLLNPNGVIQGERATFGSPIRLDLGGLGIRDMAYWGGRYMIIAGPSDGKGQSHLYEWKGGDAKPKLLKNIHLKGINPEAIVVYPENGWDEFQLLSDDSRKQDQGLFGNAGDTYKRREFRSVWINR